MLVTFQNKYVVRCVSDKTHIYVQLLFSKNRAVYEIMWKNMVQPDTLNA